MTPLFTAPHQTQCCSPTGQLLPLADSPEHCFPIVLPDDDPAYGNSNVKCMNFLRTITTRDRGCVRGATPAEQVNKSFKSCARQSLPPTRKKKKCVNCCVAHGSQPLLGLVNCLWKQRPSSRPVEAVCWRKTPNRTKARTTMASSSQQRNCSLQCTISARTLLHGW